MNARKYAITGIAALVAFAAGYGLLGLAAPAAPNAAGTGWAPDAETLRALLADPSIAGASPSNVIVLDAPEGDAVTPAFRRADDDAGNWRGDHDQDDDHDDDRGSDHDDEGRGRERD